MCNILFYGNFGNNNGEVADGQTSKTINFFYETKRIFGNNHKTTTFNTYGFIKQPLKYFFKLKKAIKKSDVIVIFPGSLLSLRIFKIAYSNSKTPILYPVVGGWIADKIKHKKNIIRFLQKFYRIYPETNGLQKKLANVGVNNTLISRTFSLREPINFSKIKEEYLLKKKSNTFNFVYFGRVVKDKGIYLAIDAIKEINRTTNYKCTLEIFGKIGSKENTNEFNKQLDENIKYFGFIKNEEVWKICRYDFFIFPSFYKGECFPACCVESLIFGTPIIASNWKDNSEIINVGSNGFLFNLEENGLKQIILNIIKNKYNILTMKENAFNDGKKYTPSASIEPFINDLREVLKNE